MRRNGSAVPGDGGLAKLSGHSENCEPLPIRGPGRARPQGKMVRKEPPQRMHLTAKVKSVLREQGVEEGVLHQCILNPRTTVGSHPRASCRAGRADRHDLILPKRRASHAAHGHVMRQYVFLLHGIALQPSSKHKIRVRTDSVRRFFSEVVSGSRQGLGGKEGLPGSLERATRHRAEKPYSGRSEASSAPREVAAYFRVLNIIRISHRSVLVSDLGGIPVKPAAPRPCRESRRLSSLLSRSVGRRHSDLSSCAHHGEKISVRHAPVNSRLIPRPTASRCVGPAGAMNSTARANPLVAPRLPFSRRRNMSPDRDNLRNPAWLALARLRSRAL
ncbi:hypothetical protein Q5P01_000061 [Channa striata]|uniref:Uncharacterized protein n=1 Tax=Channa striata TaxID=64152 RepID=A0AA88IXM2_CHASR|nr:hypothetical protein Q5P01_000061 [Channa striata]